MQLTKHTDYAFKALIFLATMIDMKNNQHNQELTTIQAIAEAFSIPKNNLMKVINILAQQNYVETIRGKNGGVKLAVDPKDISLREIVELMETTLEPLDCVGQDCVILQNCKLKKILGEALHNYLKVLENYNIADLINKPTTQILHINQ